MNNDKRPIHQLFTGEATIMSVAKKEASNYKGKVYPPKISVEVKTPDNRWMALDFKLLPASDPKAKYHRDQLNALLALLGLTELKQLPQAVGKTIAIVVTPFNYEGKDIWGAKPYAAKYLKDPLEAALDDIGAFGNFEENVKNLKEPDDELGF
jgi:hypothetical protein